MGQISIIVGGPAGTGKSTVGQLLSKQLNADFVEGDSLHPQANIDKMANGIPLTDDDRWDWLKDIAKQVSEKAQKNEHGYAVASCSALTKPYRDCLRQHSSTRLIIVFLYASEKDLLARVSGRKDHYMGANMVASQCSLMQIPDSGELDCIPIETNRSPEVLVDEVLLKLDIEKK